MHCKISKLFPTRVNLLLSTVMNGLFGARNSVGFSSAASQGLLPNPDHITYEGIFNELKYDIGQKTQKIVDLHFGYARYQFQKSQHDNSINDYLALFVKGNSDGEQRDQRRFNTIICLDVSGSMREGLGGNVSPLTRLRLSIEAIQLFVSKLRPNDSFGLVTFNQTSNVFLKPIFKKNIQNSFYQSLRKIQAGGGTSILSGFISSQILLQQFIQNNPSKSSQNRIVMLTDVCDSSITQSVQLIEKASQQKINLTIVGISNQFRSDVCQSFKNIKGFNYFCAVNQDDLQKYVNDTFDFGFFPSAYDINIKIASQDIQKFQVYGTPDSGQANQYNSNFAQPLKQYEITKVKCSFPSEIEVIDEKIFTVGGLILVKLKRKTNLPFFEAAVSLTYSDPNNVQYSQSYSIHYDFPQDEQYFSEQSLREAIEGYCFASQMKTLLSESKLMTNKIQIYDVFFSTLMDLQEIVPKSKLKDLEAIRKTVEQFGKQKVKQTV